MLTTELVAAPRPAQRLLVVLHGLGDSMEGYRWVPQALALSDVDVLLVNAPDDYYGGFSWYDIYEDPIPGVTRSRDAMHALLEQMRGEGYASRHTAIMGFSQGGLMTTEMALTHSEELAGLVSISGYVFQPETVAERAPAISKNQKLLVTHGRADDVVPMSRAKPQYAALREAGWAIDWREYAKGHTIDPIRELPEIRAFLQSAFQA